MAYTKTPSYLHRSGSLFYLKLPIAPDIRAHFPGPKGKPLTHVIEPLGTASEREAHALKKPRLAYWWKEFDRLRSGREGMTGNELKVAHQLRESMREAMERPDDGATADPGGIACGGSCREGGGRGRA